jgi:hypothetical protein
MRHLALTLALLIGACVQPPPLGSASKKAFDAQAQAGQKPNGASQLNTEEIRAILGETSPSGASKKKTNAQVKEPLNPPQ